MYLSDDFYDLVDSYCKVHVKVEIVTEDKLDGASFELQDIIEAFICLISSQLIVIINIEL